MSRAAYAKIDLDALRHNHQIVKQLAPESRVLSVIKANAYGHGLVPVAETLADITDGFAVAHLEEALRLRKELPQQKIVLLQGFVDNEELDCLVESNIEPVIHSPYQVDLLETKQLQKAFPVWLKVDTGMNRLGVPQNSFDELLSRLQKVIQNGSHIYLMTHFANSDDAKSDSTDHQIKQFSQCTNTYVHSKSLANSGAIINWRDSHFDWVRPGIMLYGASPMQNKTAKDHQLKPVMTLTSKILAINSLEKGMSVGYGSTWTADSNTKIAIVGIGYGDGYPRHIAPDTPVLIGGLRYSIVGRVSMDMLCVNLGPVTTHQVNDEVTLWGEGLPAEEIAEKAGTISYELFCQITSRVKMIYG